MLPCHQPPPRNTRRGVVGHLLQFLRKYLIKYNLFLYQILKSSFYFIKINGFRCTLIKKFTFSFRDPQEVAKREKRRLSVMACRNRKALAEAAKVAEEKEESMVTMAKKYGEKRKPKKRKYDTSSEDSSSDSDSEASGEVSLSSHSDKKWKKKEKSYRRSPTPRSPTPPLTIAKGKAMSPPPPTPLLAQVVTTASSTVTAMPMKACQMAAPPVCLTVSSAPTPPPTPHKQNPAPLKTLVSKITVSSY